MRWMVFTGLTLLLPVVALAQEAAQGHSPQRNQLPAPTAEPDNVQAYAPPAAREDEGPTSEDRGPAQQHFILATHTDTLAQEDNPPTVGNAPPEKIALDKRIKIALIHDVQNDGLSKDTQNHALAFELIYLNWGAVTQSQLEARRGHYFTNTWTNRDAKGDFVAYFQYRQVKSREIVRTLTEPMLGVKGTVRSYFAVVGKAYLAYGPVASWRFTIRRGDTVVAEAKSFIW